MQPPGGFKYQPKYYFTVIFIRFACYRGAWGCAKPVSHQKEVQLGLAVAERQCRFPFIWIWLNFGFGYSLSLRPRWAGSAGR